MIATSEALMTGLRRRLGVLSVGGVMVLGAATCGGSSAPADVAAGQSASGSPADSGKGVVVDGERFATRVINDPTEHLPVGVVAVPASWTFESHVVWIYAHPSTPVTVTMSASNPANGEAFTTYAPVQYFDLRPGGVGLFQRGREYGAMTFLAPQPALETLANAITQERGREPGFTFVGSKDLPDLPSALKVPPAPHQQGLSVKVAYTRNGKPFEEEFYAVYDLVEIPYDGPRGRTWQINWGLTAFHSFRAPAGTLDHRRPVFAAIPKSFRPNPAWRSRAAAIQQVLGAEFDRQLKAGYDQIAAAAALSKQLTANSNAFLANVDRQLQANAASHSTTDERPTKDYNASFDDYIRGVVTTDDPYYGTSQHSLTEEFHWTDGYGNYRNTNDASADPNRTEVGQWVQMKVIR
jgi:hypothetical protein